jgi:hypothetical protein
MRMPLVDGDELGAEAESDDGDVEFAAHAGNWTGIMEAGRDGGAALGKRHRISGMAK